VLKTNRLLFDKSKLDSVVTIASRDTLCLDHNAGSRFDDRHGGNRAVLSEELRHTHFSANASTDHNLDLRPSICGSRLRPAFQPTGFRDSQIANSLVFAKRLDLDINTSRKIKLHQRIDRFGRRVENIHQTLVRADLELLT